MNRSKEYTLYDPKEPVGMRNKTAWVSHGMNIGVQYEEILASTAVSGCCNATLLKYNYTDTKSWPVCSSCHHAFTNGIISEN